MKGKIVVGAIVAFVILWYMPSQLTVVADFVSSRVAGNIPVGSSDAIETFVYWWVVLQTAFAPLAILVAQPILRTRFMGRAE